MVRRAHYSGMTLGEYMAQEGLKDADLAEMCGRDRSRINRIRRGLAKPPLDLLVRLEEITGGAVKASDFLTRAA